jgi:TRAP-type C4-dicarboxylate transport system permease large subunit
MITRLFSTIGPIIPSSVSLVIYGVLANVFIGRLLIAGIITGLSVGVALMIMVASHVNNCQSLCPILYPFIGCIGIYNHLSFSRHVFA